MNANELIESLRRKILHKYHGGADLVTEITVSERDDIIRALSHSRIRETATEPPTREDADEEGYIHSHHAVCGWMVHTVETVNEHPEKYLFWTRMPEDPEANP